MLRALNQDAFRALALARKAIKVLLMFIVLARFTIRSALSSCAIPERR